MVESGISFDNEAKAIVSLYASCILGIGVFTPEQNQKIITNPKQSPSTESQHFPYPPKASQ